MTGEAETETSPWQVKKEAWKVYMEKTRPEWQRYLDSTKTPWYAYRDICESVGLKATRGGY